MSKQQVLMVLGIWMAVLLFLGFPSAWDKFFALASGILVAGIAWSMRDRRAAPSKEVPFVEHKAEVKEVRSVDGITSTNNI